MDSTDIPTEVPGPKYPPGTPEYEAYAAALACELKSFSAGEPPYDFGGAPGEMYQATVRGIPRVRVLRLDKGPRQPKWWSVTHREQLGTSLHYDRQVDDLRTLVTIDPEVALHQVAAMLAMGDATASEIMAALTIGARS